MDIDMQEILSSEYLRVPHPILQMQQVLKNASTYACLQFIWAKTGGWRKGEDTISYSQFKDDEKYGTGLSIKTIQRSVEKLEELGVINTKPSFNRMYEFSVNIEKIKELVAQIPSKKGKQVKSNSPDLEITSQVNLSSNAVNLSASQVNLSAKSSHIDLHKRTITKELLQKNKTGEVLGNSSEEKKLVISKKQNLITQQANALIDFWNDNHGKGESANIKHKVWVATIKTRLKTFSEDEIKTSMLSVINSHWHQQNKQVLIKNAIDSDKRCEQAIAKYVQPTANKIDRTTDKLAVNKKWPGANQSNMVEPNTTLEEMMGSW